jgi:hypothetical protein
VPANTGVPLNRFGEVVIKGSGTAIVEYCTTSLIDQERGAGSNKNGLVARRGGGGEFTTETQRARRNTEKRESRIEAAVVVSV